MKNQNLDFPAVGILKLFWEIEIIPSKINKQDQSRK